MIDKQQGYWPPNAENDKKKCKTNSTRASHVLTNRTTSRARPNLTSGIGRDRVECE